MGIIDTIQQIDLLKKEAEKLQSEKSKYEKRFFEKFRLEFNYNSNHLEGNTLTYGHTQLLLIFDKIGSDYTGREIEEMKNHDVAMKMVKESALEAEHLLTEKFIREINEIILVRPFYKEAITLDGQSTRRLIEPGKYKKYSNSVQLENGEIYNYANPEETPSLMGDLIEWYKKEAKSNALHPVQLAALFHYRFVRIHPFDDSNGRTSRLLMNYILMKNGYAPVVVESIDKKNYLTALNKADIGDIEAIIEYICTLSLQWQRLFVTALKGEKIEDTGDFEKEVEVLKKSMQKELLQTSQLSIDVAANIVEATVLPIIQKLFGKLSSLDSFAHTKLIQFGFNTPNHNVINIEEVKEIARSQQSELSENSSIIFNYILSGLPFQNNQVTSYPCTLLFKFNRYTYSIYTEEGGPSLFEKKYHQLLTEPEIEMTVDIVAQKALSYIKSGL